MIATRFHAAVPVSQEFFASPWVAASFPAIICAYTYGSQRCRSLSVLTGRRVDPPVVVERRVAAADHRLGDHHPRVGVAEDAGVLLVAGRVGRDLAELHVVPAVRRAGAARCRASVASRSRTLSSARVAMPFSTPIPAMHADALRLDEDLALLVLAGADHVAEVVVGAAEPVAVPAVLDDGGGHLVRRGPVARVRRPGRAARPAPASSRAARMNSPAMNTDSALPPARLAVVWNDSPGVSEKQLRFRQSFQSARPISGSACGPSRSSV